MNKKYNHKGISVKSFTYPDDWDPKMPDKVFNAFIENIYIQLGIDLNKKRVDFKNISNERNR